MVNLTAKAGPAHRERPSDRPFGNGPDPAELKDWNHDREKFKLGIKDFLLETESDSDGRR
jgi:hypothetical protein